MHGCSASLSPSATAAAAQVVGALEVEDDSNTLEKQLTEKKSELAAAEATQKALLLLVRQPIHLHSYSFIQRH